MVSMVVDMVVLLVVEIVIIYIMVVIDKRKDINISFITGEC